jgi:hypothetical protein
MADLGVLAYFLRLLKVVFIPAGIVLVVCLTLRIIIAKQLGWRNLSKLGRASLIVFCVQRIPSPLTLTPISVIMFMIDRRKEFHKVGIEMAYVVSEFLVILCGMASLPLIIQQWIQYEFEMQLAGVREDWKPEETFDDVAEKIKQKLKRRKEPNEREQ